MINLLPPAVKSERRFGRLNKVLVTGAVAVLALAAICAGIILFSYQQIRTEARVVEQEIADNQTQIKNLETTQQQIDQVAQQLEIIKKLQENEVEFSVVVPQIGSIIPPGAILTNLSLTGQKDQPLQLSFKLKSQELASVLRQNLVNSPMFESADILNVTSEGSEDDPTVSAYPYSASVVVSFEGAPKKATAKAATP